jgi:multidrug efflux pump subunit AcrA (membrane-fusion protein)
MHYLRNGTAAEPEGAVAGDTRDNPDGHENASRHSKLLVTLMVVLLIGVLFFVFVGLRRRASPRTSINKTSGALTMQTGSILRIEGTTEAVRSRSILSPILSGQQVGSLTITKLAHAGARVKRGDLLVEFDRQGQMRDFFDKQAEYSKLVDQVIQEQAKESAAHAKDETELLQAENDLKKAELEIQKAEILSRIDGEKAQETLEETRTTSQQLRETFELKRRAAQAAIRILEIQRDRTRQTMAHAQANAELMQIHSPIDGVVVLNTIWKEGKMGEVQEGDQIRPGQPFMQVVDPSEMQVLLLVNQQDFLPLRLGQLGKVRLDAYPELMFSGRVEQISPIGRGGSFSAKVRNFAVVFSIQGTDPRLMPDLSAAVDLDLASTFTSAQGASQ